MQQRKFKLHIRIVFHTNSKEQKNPTRSGGIPTLVIPEEIKPLLLQKISGP